MPIKITDLTVHDIRFPTSRALDGSDAMNPAPDYSATYVVLETNAPQGLAGHGLTFTIGRGNEISVAAVRSLAPLVIGATLEDIVADMGGFWRYITTGDIWQLLVDMSPPELVRCLDFRYVTDALTPDEAIALLEANVPTKGKRERQMRESGYPAYTTSAGWLGYSDEKVRRLAREGVAAGWTHFKQKVGGDIGEDVRRARILREEIGWERKLMMDANQVWGVDQSIRNMHRLAEFRPWWIEEPTSPDDILGHATIRKQIAPIGVATGEHCQVWGAGVPARRWRRPVRIRSAHFLIRLHLRLSFAGRPGDRICRSLA